MKLSKSKITDLVTKKYFTKNWLVKNPDQGIIYHKYRRPEILIWELLPDNTPMFHSKQGRVNLFLTPTYKDNTMLVGTVSIFTYVVPVP